MRSPIAENFGPRLQMWSGSDLADSESDLEMRNDNVPPQALTALLLFLGFSRSQACAKKSGRIPSAPQSSGQRLYLAYTAMLMLC
jgi:hypothetical protein